MAQSDSPDPSREFGEGARISIPECGMAPTDDVKSAGRRADPASGWKSEAGGGY